MPLAGQRDQVAVPAPPVSSTHLSCMLLNEARTGYARNRNLHFPDLVGSDIVSQIGIEGVGTTGLHDIPVFNITGLLERTRTPMASIWIPISSGQTI